MSTPPIRIPISADDQYSAEFQKLKARLAELEGAGAHFGQHTASSFHEAKGAAALLGEEVGVKLNRHLRGVLATSELLGPVLAASFNVVAAIGFIEVAKGIYEKIAGIKQLEEDLAASKEWQKHAQEVHKQYVQINREIQLIGKSEEAQFLLKQRFAAEDRGQLEQFKKQLQDEVALLDQKDRVISKTFGRAFGRGAGTAGVPVVADIGGLSDEDFKKRKEKVEEIHNIDLELSLKTVQVQKDGLEAGDSAHKKLLEDLKEENREADKFWQTWNKLNDEIDKGARELQAGAFGEAGKRSASLRKDFSPWLDPKLAPPSGAPLRTDQTELLKLQNDLNESWSKARQILDQIETPAEHYRATIAELKELLAQGRINQEQFNAAVAQAKQHFDPLTIATMEFGKAMGDALKQGFLMGRNWQDIFKSLLVTVAELIIRFTVLKQLEDKFGKGGAGGGWGGLLTALVGSFSGGHAAGGYMSPGTWGIAGENGPEPIFAGATGMTILPNRSMGGGGNTFIIDARGAEIGVEQKIVAAMNYAVKTAVAQSVGIVRENSLRGRG